jgi:hypothetical protein
VDELSCIDVAALLRRLSSAGNGNGATPVPITSDGDGSHAP